MSGELVPRPPETRLSDVDRERVVERLRGSLGEGRMTLEEFEQRLTGVLSATTFGEVSTYLDDLPGGPVAVSVPDFTELRATAGSVKRRGYWLAPRRLAARVKSGSMRLDFTEAVVAHRTVEIEVAVNSGSVTLVLPPDASVDTDGVELVASSASVRGVPTHPGTGPRFVVTGTLHAGRLTVRHQRRFLRWRW